MIIFELNFVFGSGRDRRAVSVWSFKVVVVCAEPKRLFIRQLVDHSNVPSARRRAELRKEEKSEVGVYSEGTTTEVFDDGHLSGAECQVEPRDRVLCRSLA